LRSNNWRSRTVAGSKTTSSDDFASSSELCSATSIFEEDLRFVTDSLGVKNLREYVTKLESSVQQAERADNAKEADRLRTILAELNEYEHDMLYPLAAQRISINLDDGVLVNYRTR